MLVRACIGGLEVNVEAYQVAVLFGGVAGDVEGGYVYGVDAQGRGIAESFEQLLNVGGELELSGA